MDIHWQYGATFSKGKGGHKEHAVHHVRERRFIVHPDASNPLAFVLIAGRGPNSKTFSHQMADVFHILTFALIEKMASALSPYREL